MKEKIEAKKYWVWLSLIPGLGCVRKKQLLEKYKTPYNIYKLNREQLLENKGIGDRTVDNILNFKIREKIDKYMEYMLKNKINIITIKDKEYPDILKKIYDPPISLYIKGNKEILNKNSIAVIGCRDASNYGKKVAKYFSYNFAKQRLNVVSGLAKGIDSYAHMGCICGNGTTIAVLGNGLNTIYPKENQYLADKIVETGGAIITEYNIGDKIEKINFPARNRIISGMSKAVIVVEAKEKSGTLVTVDFALEQGRDVYVVPGNIDSINSVGTNHLIKIGAKMITNYTDVDIW